MYFCENYFRMSFKRVFENIDFLLLILIFLSITILPSIQIEGLPVVNVDDYLLPLVLLRIYKNKIFKPTLYVWLLVAFMGYILFTIFLNSRYNSVQDYFEIYKIGKFLLVVLFSQHVLKSHFEKFTWVIKSVFLYLLVFNLFHYFSLFNFNQTVMPYFSVSEIHLSTFGLDSLGNPSSKRMIGTMSNPNINAIFFLFFYSFFFVNYGKSEGLKNRIWIYLSFLCILLTQSRTAFISLAFITFFWFVFAKYDYKRIFIQLGAFVMLVFIAYLINIHSVIYYTNTNVNIMENSSMMGRFETWQHLWEMILQKPVFGHGPNKNYFYDNQIYAESEYVLYLWRYGVIGLFFYLSWILMPLRKSILQNRENAHYLLFAIVILINSLTNSPLSNPSILLLFAISIGYYFAFPVKINQTDHV